MKKPLENRFSTRPRKFADVEEAQNWIEDELMPTVTRLLDIANERAAHYEAASVSSTYEWQVKTIGDLFIRQTSGATLLLDTPADTDITPLRTGRHWTATVHNLSGGVLDVTFGSDFTTLGTWSLSDDQIATWTFYKTDDSAGIGRLVEVQ